MWVRKIELNQVKCIEQLSIDLGTDEERHKWVTLLGDNGTGKTTILQALALTLSGWNPIGLVEFKEVLELSHLLKEKNTTNSFDYAITQIKNDSVDVLPEKIPTENLLFTKLTQVTNPFSEFKILLVDKQKDLKYNGTRIPDIFEQPNCWFAAGYGAFRHISKKPTLSTPELVEPNKRNNFLTLFRETEALSGFHQWLITLDYERLKNG